MRAIYCFEEKHRRAVKAVELAKELHLAKSTISERLRELAHAKLVKPQYSTLLLTAKGRSLARTLTYKHRIIEVFLHDMLHVDKNKIHAEANKLEHAFSDECIERLRRLVGNPRFDPHGKPIQAA